MTDYMQQTISVLGSTGSVGEQTLDVAAQLSVPVTSLSANCNYLRVEEQARKFRVHAVAMADETAAKELKIRLADTDIRIYAGSAGICEMIGTQQNDVIVNAIIGEAGLLPSLSILDSGTRLALANKESLVVAGHIVTERARKNKVEILPVDSEHCAIFQCLKAGKQQEIKRIVLTASGGPFWGYTKEQLKNITVSQALAHPTWKMGAKITIDSATLMNKGFEVIEAVHLFDVPVNKIHVLVHRESIIHSMVEYIDNSVIAQLSVPDMRLCAQYAITYPSRTKAVIDELDLSKLSRLTFFDVDSDTFSLLPCAIACIQKGGALPAVLNAANEVAVSGFLNGKIPFHAISEVVCAVVSSLEKASSANDLESILLFDRYAREQTANLLK